MKTLAARKHEAPAVAPAEHRGRLPSATVSPAALERAVRLFKALGDPSRLRLLVVLAQGELCVSEIAGLDHDGLSTVSQRLRVLRAADLVSRRRHGQHILYGLADAHLAELISNALAHASESLPAKPVVLKKLKPSKSRKGARSRT